ncbi:uncharacterized protein LDX57_001179 [Aspergillus melleus]|uniref:uncharacterized protein n=1 Tax=Aspergillus melleus TaxID=138277 RepID=UPI001E8D756C|nr:uncharacterized protein LDX57_001179 [Aspergillus melleus]KAH8423418.1 hypothetical protein LDX57_001179 [Aspergillus melleus]
MATSFQPNVHYTFGSPLSPNSLFGPRRVSSILEHNNASNGPIQSPPSRRSSRKSSSGEVSQLADVVNSLTRQTTDGMDSVLSTKLMNATYPVLLEFIRTERMSKLPPEGSSYDRVLVWASLFVERLHSFELAIEEFAGDSPMAAQLAYGHCAVLLELGEENASALMLLFGFFCSCSMGLVNLLDRVELFSVSQDIKDQLVLALADLVTLVVSVATHFHKSIKSLTSESVSIDIYGTFPGPIESFRNRCQHVSESMWRHQLTREGLGGDKVSNIKSIQHWLEPEDPVLANMVESMAHLAQEREELTCLWLTPYLTRFMKGNQKTLAISGKAGSGKTIASSVIADNLQYPIGGVRYTSVYVPINGRVSARTSSRAIAETILLQVFNKRIGNVGLYQILAEAHERCQKTTDEEPYDNILWNALGHALESSLKGAKELVLVIDGLDEASCGEQNLSQRLKEATTSNVKLITLGSQQQTTTPDQIGLRITSDLIFDDVAAVVRSVLRHSRAFTEMSEAKQEIGVNRITQAADGSFLWAKLAAKRVVGESPHNAQAFSKAVESLARPGQTIADLVSPSLSPKSLNEDGRNVLGWLASAARPLSQQELSSLLAIQVDKGIIRDQSTDMSQILKPVSSLVFIQNDLVYLRHAQIKAAIVEILSHGKPSQGVRDRNLDLAQRLLVYAKNRVTKDQEPSLASLDSHFTRGLLEKHPLLDFALRYWIDHTKNALTCNTESEIASAAKELRNVIPTRTAIPLLEMTVWETKPTPVVMSLHDIQTRLYQQILTPNHPTTLQAILCQALFYREIQESAPSKTSWLFYYATKISQDVLSVSHLVTMQMAKNFLDITAEQMTDSKTEIMVKRVEVFQILVECYKIHYGSTSEITLTTMNQLAEHYQLIKDERRAQEITRDVQKASTVAYSHWSTTRQSEDSLRVHLHGRHAKHTATGVALDLNDIEQDELIESSAQYSLKSRISHAEKQVSEGNVQAAERTYVEAWQQTSALYRHHRSAEWELKNAKAVLAYSKFLQSQGRSNEVASVLAGFWQEYDRTTSNSEAVVSQFVEVAKVMKSVGLSVLALDVFKSCSQFYQSSGNYQNATYKSIQQNIQSTSKDVMQLASSSKSTVSEKTLKEIVYSDSFDQSSVSAANTLVETYISQHRWHDATKTLKRVLQAIWPAFFAPSLQDVVLPTSQVDHCVALAERLGDCYRSRRRPTKEEDTRLRVYRAVRRDRQPGDKMLDRTTTSLLRVYQRTSQTDKQIELHKELLEDYTKHYGGDHPTVIKKLWTLAELSPSPASIDYYRRIVQALNKDSDTCHPDAFEPLLLVSNELWNHARYAEAVPHFKVMFNALRNSTINPKLHDQVFVRTMFSRYVQCLRAIQADSSVLHDVASQYHHACRTLFGSSASISIQATMTLANICQESKRYETEAVRLYEELLQIKSDEVDRHDVRATLEAIYEEQAAAVATKAETVSSEQMARVVSIRNRRLSSVRSNYGWAHEESLTEMQELVSLYSKRGQSQAVLSLLREGTVQTLSTEKSSTRLTDAAKSIASSYIASGQVQQARELTQELYRQIIAKDTSNTRSVSFDLSSKQRESLVFLAQMEYSLRDDSSVTFNEIFSSLATEYLYYEQFRTEISSKSSTVQSVITCASRLYGFLLSRGRQWSASRVVDQCTTYFLSTEGKSYATTTQANAFVTTLLSYFTTHWSYDFLRSVAIASYDQVIQLLSKQQYEAACDQALTAFHYLQSHNGFASTTMMKLGFKLGLAISGRELSSSLDRSTQQAMLNSSSTIMHEIMSLFKARQIDLTQLDLTNLNNLIGLLDDQHDYQNLAWVLTSLWNNRDTHSTSQPKYVLALGRMLIITRYLVGDYSGAIRLAEDIVYNCARVHGPRHPATIEMTVLLSQMYTSVAQGYQGHKESREVAFRYYKKAASLHENALRVFVDPTVSADLDEGFESGFASPGRSPSPGGDDDEGKYVRQHLHLLKLAVERLGEWPKEYSEYERLSSDVFKAYKQDLDGVEGVEKWNLKNFGSGRAEAADDLIMANSAGASRGVPSYQEQHAIAV